MSVKTSKDINTEILNNEECECCKEKETDETEMIPGEMIYGNVFHDEDNLLDFDSIKQMWQIFQYYDPARGAELLSNDDKPEIDDSKIREYQHKYLELRQIFISLTKYDNGTLLFLLNFKAKEQMKIINSNKKFSIEMIENNSSDYNELINAFFNQTPITGYFGHSIGVFLFI